MSKQDTRSKPARRRYEAAFKDQLVQRCLQPGVSVSGVALENGINANVLFRWRREHLLAVGLRADAARAVLLPVRMAVEPVAPASRPQQPVTAGVIEVDIAGAQVRVRGCVDEASVRGVLRALRELA